MSSSRKTTIIVPVYNEAGSIENVISDILNECGNTGLEFTVWVLDDGSTDWRQDIEHRLTEDKRVMVKHAGPNKGKGAVLNQYFRKIPTEYAVVMDADGEYSAADIPSMLEILMRNQADWVMGSRYGFGRPRPRQYLATYLCNRWLNVMFHLLSGVRFKDLLTGLYAFRTATTAHIHLECTRFSYTPELIWKVLRSEHPRWQEVPISYRFRTYAEGKSIKWWETFTIMWAMIRYRGWRPKTTGDEQ